MSDTDIKIKAIFGEVCYPIPSPYPCETLTCVPLQRTITSVSSSSACRSSTTRPKTSRPPTCPNYKPPPTWWYNFATNCVVDRRIWYVSFSQVGPGDLVEVHGRVTGPSFSNGIATGTSVRVTDIARIMKAETMTLKRSRSTEDLSKMGEILAKKAKTDEAGAQ
ncbi:hypothetical protein BCR44DRAFT_42004 [Catenaria anguillulae PL171]|uniref:Uncharacterized protein n=1 Tax=Catenaria anguillulae PL171 TaxID=765915 RepID=A0A1Y2I1C1_9FUNG|nr:hypothetical protein BCR44DRAFT_42004 [Catenaria anguillulae PL171]